jgi:hypothetical protein
VPQHEQLDVLGRRRPAEQDQPAAKPDEDQVEQTKATSRDPAAACPSGQTTVTASVPSSEAVQGLFVIPVPLVWLVDRYVRPLQVRRYLVEMAHYGNYNDARQSAPDMRELRLYGNVLKGGYE